jgi:hypothetical protein
MGSLFFSDADNDTALFTAPVSCAGLSYLHPVPNGVPTANRPLQTQNCRKIFYTIFINVSKLSFTFHAILQFYT